MASFSLNASLLPSYRAEVPEGAGSPVWVWVRGSVSFSWVAAVSLVLKSILTMTFQTIFATCTVTKKGRCTNMHNSWRQ